MGVDDEHQSSLSTRVLDSVVSIREVHDEPAARMSVARSRYDFGVRPTTGYYFDRVVPLLSFEDRLRLSCGVPDMLGLGKLLNGILTGSSASGCEAAEFGEFMGVWPFEGSYFGYTGL